MKFIADLHIHSRFSRATSRELNLENLHIAAQCKGIQVISTGDATHPGWFEEIRSCLVPAEPGLYRLDDNLARVCDLSVPVGCRGPVRFVLSSEISNIYKKDGYTRKNHNLVFLPDIDAAERFNARLNKIGNIRSDGRPILGLDAHDLLDIVLSVHPQAFLVPAHIWTPWFSMLGSRSGFDSLDACFGDLAKYVFAAETGLSSDPEMNWRVSWLDRLTLISNSDAHSAAKLGREANCFDSELSFEGIRSALEHPGTRGFQGTLEFYPEEGKYHLDGHRKCAVRLSPSESRRIGGICPVCHRPLTLGVLHRVESLADRATPIRPATAPSFRKLVPLMDILAEVMKCGASSKRVATAYRRCLEQLGSELAVLQEVSLEKVASMDIPLLDEALRRMRRGELTIDGGYDGEFGTIRIFTPEERRRVLGQKSLFALPKLEKKVAQESSPPPHTAFSAPIMPLDVCQNPSKNSLNELQQEAVAHTGGPMMVVAGPGTGKTFTLTRRIVRLIESGTAAPETILALTFTQKAADEMQRRVVGLLGKGAEAPLIGTFHGICYRFIREIEGDRSITIIDPEHRLALVGDAITRVAEDAEEKKPPFSARQILPWIEAIKQGIGEPEKGGPEGGDATAQYFFQRVFEAYQGLLTIQGLLDFDDLLAEMVVRLEGDENLREAFRSRFAHVLVDEYQDLNHAQYRLVRALAGPGANLFVIGDPDQCIYGFRGSDWHYFEHFTVDYPNTKVIRLDRSYRSPQSVLDAAGQLMAHSRDGREHLSLIASAPGRCLGLIRTESEKAEAVAIGRTIERMVGGSGFEAINFGKVDAHGGKRERSFADFAVLYRTHRQGVLINEILEEAGIPCQLASRSRICETPHVAGLISLLRMVADQGIFVDLEKVLPWIRVNVSAGDVQRFRQWCYAKGFNLKNGLYQATRLPVEGIPAPRQRRLAAALAKLEVLVKDAQNLGLSACIDYLLEKTCLSEAFGAASAETGMAALRDWVDACRNETDLILHLNFYSDTDVYDARAERVALMTLHAAKGLEFDVVFIAGCEDGLIPMRQSIDPDEERRLFYVGLTRARERLFLCAAARRIVQGRSHVQSLSPFAADIDPRLLEALDPERGPCPRRRQTQMSLF